MWSCIFLVCRLDIWEGYDVTSVHALGQEQIASLNILAVYSGWVKKKCSFTFLCNESYIINGMNGEYT